MTASLLPVPKASFFDINGDPLAGGKVYTYTAGTDTPKSSYTTYAGNVANANPVILDSAGQANIWLNGNYKIVLKNSSDVVQWTVDDVLDIYSAILTGTNTWTGANTFSGATTFNGITNINKARTLTSYYTVGNPASEQGIDITGNVNIYGNSLTLGSVDPSSLAYITLGGSVTTGDTVTLTFHFSSTTQTAAYTTLIGDTLDDVAAGLALAIQANTGLYVPISVTNPAGGGPPGQITAIASNSNPLTVDYDSTHAMTITYVVSGSATETVSINVTTAWDANPLLAFTKNPGIAPPAGSNLLQFLVAGSNSASPTTLNTQYASMSVNVLNSTASSLSAVWGLLTTTAAGTIGTGIYIGGGLWTSDLGTVGVDKGEGSINVGDGYYIQGVNINHTQPGGTGSASGQVLTAAQMVGGIFQRQTQASATDTTDTAAHIVAALPTIVVGYTFDILLINQMAGTWTLNAGSGVTYGTATGTLALAGTTERIVKVFAANVGSGTEAITIY